MADSLESMLDTPGWQEVLEPHLQKEIIRLNKLLLEALRAGSMHDATILCGNIESLDNLFNHIETIKRRGQSAREALASYKPSVSSVDSI